MSDKTFENFFVVEYFKMLEIAKRASVNNSVDIEFELLALQYAVSRQIINNNCTPKNSYELQVRTVNLLDYIYNNLHKSKFDVDLLGRRIGLYNEIINGLDLRCDFLGAIFSPNMAKCFDPTKKSVCLFGDILFNPLCATDYTNAPRLFPSAYETDVFLQNTLSPILDILTNYCCTISMMIQDSTICKKSLTEIVVFYYNKMLTIIQESPFNHSTDRVELVFAMCACSDYIAWATKKDRYAVMDSVESSFEELCPGISKNLFDERMWLYGEIIRGNQLHGDWNKSGKPLSSIIGTDAISRIVSLLGDALYNPRCISSYLSGERVIKINNPYDDYRFFCDVMMPLLSSMRDYSDELAE